ncbi:MAG TPA: dihydroneopterin aldolase [Polyangiaceae bacterium]|nr:dihydroneopterin aldolase [Polyangiaceae bacterium]
MTADLGPPRASAGRDAILIEGLQLDCIVGLRPQERVRAQPVVLDLELGLSLASAGRSGRIAHTCDYDLVAESVRSLLAFREYHLVEAATEELAAMLLGLHPALERVRIRIAKPAALLGRARSAAVQIERTSADFPRQRLARAGGTLELLLETREAGLYALTVAAGAPVDRELSAAARRDGRRATAWVVRGMVTTAAGTRGPGAAIGLEDAAGVTSEREGPALLFLCTTPPLELAGLAAGGVAPGG